MKKYYNVEIAYNTREMIDRVNNFSVFNPSNYLRFIKCNAYIIAGVVIVFAFIV